MALTDSHGAIPDEVLAKVDELSAKKISAGEIEVPGYTD